jgi:hypothetical protein
MKNQQKANIERQRKAMDLWLSRKAEIVALYAMGDQSQAQMAQRYGVTLAGFQKALARLGIAPKSRGRAGAANGRFKDGAQCNRVDSCATTHRRYFQRHRVARRMAC